MAIYCQALEMLVTECSEPNNSFCQIGLTRPKNAHTRFVNALDFVSRIGFSPINNVDKFLGDVIFIMFCKDRIGDKNAAII